MRSVVVLVCSALILTTACAPAGEIGNGDTAMRQILNSYAIDFLRHNPATSTYLGGSAFDPSLREIDGRLRDYSDDALEQENRWLRVVQLAIEGVDRESLSPSVRIDRDVALAQIEFMLRQHLVRRYQLRALDTYVSEPVQALEWQVQRLTPTGDGTYGTVEEWALVIRRLRSVPAYLDTAQQQLLEGVASHRVPDWRMVERDGLIGAEAHARYLKEAFPGMVAARFGVGPERQRLEEELTGAAQVAADAYLRFRDFVAATYFYEGELRYAGDLFSIGEEEYEWSIKNNFSVSYVEELYREAQTTTETIQSVMVNLARDIVERWNARPFLDDRDVDMVFDVLSRDFPRSDAEMVSWYRDTADRLTEFGQLTDVLGMPIDYQPEVVEVPAASIRSVDDVAYYPAPVFKNLDAGRFYVTPTGDDLAALRRSSRASLAVRTAREGFPGKDWLFSALAASDDSVSPVRWLLPGSVKDSSSMWMGSMTGEGWAVYAEELMAESSPGPFLDQYDSNADAVNPLNHAVGVSLGVYSPEERFYQLQAQLERVVRAQVDLGIHSGRLTYAQATTLFSEVVERVPGSCGEYIEDASRSQSGGASELKRASCERSERVVFGISKWPTEALAHWYGWARLRGLRADAMNLLGSQYSQGDFHNRLIHAGPISVEFFNEYVLDELEQMSSLVQSSQ